MKIVFIGTPEFAVPVLEALNSKYEIALVVSQPNRVKKKGVFIDTPVAAKAKELGLNIIQPEKIGEEYEYLKSLEADVLVSAAYGQYVPTKILNLYKKTLNVHGSLLPKHRGGAPIQRAIMNGDDVTGVTIIEMAKKLDAGVMYAKKQYAIKDTDTSDIVFNELSIIGTNLLMEVIEDVYNGKLVGEVQNEEEATFSSNLTAEEEFISFDMPARMVVRHINSLSSNPGASIKVNDMIIKVYEAEEVVEQSDLAPGTVISLKKQVLIKAKDNAVKINKILVPGKKVLPARDFVNGQKIFKELDVI